MQSLASLHHLSDWALLVLRLGLGTVFLVHGIQKRAMWKMQPSAQMPAGLLSIIKVLSIAEPLSGLAMIGGLLTQVAAVGQAVVMLGAIRLKAGQMKKRFTGDGGWELDFIILVAALAIIVLGAGRFSLDRVLLGL